MNLLVNPMTTHKNARYFAVIAYFVGMLLQLAGFLTDGTVGVVLAIAGLAVWFVPVSWAAYMWSKGDSNAK